MDPISQKIIEARIVREQAEARRLREQEEELARLQAHPEFKRRARLTDALLKLYETFKVRCEAIQAETAELRPEEQLHVEVPEINPVVSIAHSPEPADWGVRLNEARLRIEVDPDGSDDQVDFFGSITLLGPVSARKSFYVTPQGEFYVLQDACGGPHVCPMDYYSLRAALVAGVGQVKTTFAEMLDDGLHALVAVALAIGVMPDGWTEIRVTNPFIGGPSGSVRNASFKELGIENFEELRRLAGVGKLQENSHPT